MDGIINSAKYLRKLLSGVVVNQKAAEVLYSLNILIDEHLKKVNYQPATYLIYADKPAEDSEDAVDKKSLADTQEVPPKVTFVGRNSLKIVLNGGEAENTGAIVVSEFTKERTSRHTDAEMRYKCAFCDYKAHRKFMVQKHMVYHTGEKPFQCNQCDYRVAYKSDLKKHMRKHTGEKPYSCAECNQTFKQAAGLRTHSLIHTGERPYKCAYCDFRSGQSSTVKTHISLKHLGERNHACEYCNYRCGTVTAVRRHVERKHIGKSAKSYQCGKCSFTSLTHYAVTIHIRTVHNKDDMSTSKEPTNSCNLCDNGIVHAKEGLSYYSCAQCEFTTAKCYEVWFHAKEKHPSASEQVYIDDQT